MLTVLLICLNICLVVVIVNEKVVNALNLKQTIQPEELSDVIESRVADIKEHTIRDIEKLQKDTPQADSYRAAIAIYASQFAKCKRSCLHYSRDKAASSKKK